MPMPNRISEPTRDKALMGAAEFHFLASQLSTRGLSRYPHSQHSWNEYRRGKQGRNMASEPAGQNLS